MNPNDVYKYLHTLDPEDVDDYSALLSIASQALAMAETRDGPVPDIDRVRRAASNVRIAEGEIGRAKDNVPEAFE